jgi:hypothetical protein
MDVRGIGEAIIILWEAMSSIINRRRLADNVIAYHKQIRSRNTKCCSIPTNSKEAMFTPAKLEEHRYILQTDIGPMN